MWHAWKEREIHEFITLIVTIVLSGKRQREKCDRSK